MFCIVRAPRTRRPPHKKDVKVLEAIQSTLRKNS